MADSVLLSGADARIHFTVGSANIVCGPITMAFVMKRAAVSVWDEILTATDWDNYRMLMNDGNQLCLEVGGTGLVSGPSVNSTEWRLIAVTKPTGTSTPRGHVYDGTTWTHSNLSGTVGVGTAASSQWKFSNTGGDAFHGNGLIFGIDNTEFSDGAIEALAAGYAAWIDAGFLEGVRLDAATGLTSYTGGTMAQSTTVGASLDTGDVPTWWDDSLEEPPPAPETLRVVRTPIRIG